MMQETTNGMLMEISCVHNQIFLCVGRMLSNTLNFLFSVWNMISIKDAPHIREKYAIRISSTYVVAIFEREVLPARNLKFSKIQGHQRKLFQK